MAYTARVIYNQKGGVGKTTLSVNLAAASALKGKRTLVIDCDPQANATSYFLGHANAEKTIGDFFESCLGINLFRLSLSQFLTTQTKVANLHLVAGDRNLEDLRNKLENKHKINKLRDGLQNLSYDVIYFDPPPAKDFYSLSCLIAADEVLVPVDCDAFSVQAAKEILEIFQEVRADHNPTLKLRGIIVNQFQKTTRHAAAMIADLRRFGFPVLEPYIPSSVKVRESHSEACPLIIGQPRHAVSKAISALLDNIDGVNVPSENKVSEENRGAPVDLQVW